MPRSSASAWSITGWSCTASRSTATARPSRAIAAARIAALLALLIACLPLHLLTKAATGRSRWPRRFLAAAGRICGLRVRAEGVPARPRSLLVPNHVSWLDIPAIAAATGCAFVSKDRLGNPLLHWLADQNGTIYVNRDHRRGAPGQAEAVARKLRGEQPLALFPEGTTGPGDRLLPFRPALLSAVAPPPAGVEVRPVAIDYGPLAGELGWHGESGRDNFLRLLGRRGAIPVTIRLLDPLPPLADRKALAALAREAIAAALASSRRPESL